MDGRSFDASRKLISNVMRHPLTRVVHHIDLDGEQFGLELVADRLDNKEFSSLSQFLAAIEDVWQRCMPLLESYGPMFVTECRRIVDKERHQVGLLDKRTWASDIVHVKTELFAYLEKQPASVKDLTQASLVKPVILKPKIPLVRKRKYENFLDAVKQMSESEVEAICDTIRRLEPGRIPDGADTDLNVAELKLETFQAIEASAKEMFRERGEPYPGHRQK